MEPCIHLRPPRVDPSLHLAYPCPIKVEVVREHSCPCVLVRERHELRDELQVVDIRARGEEDAEVGGEWVYEALQCRVVLGASALGVVTTAVPIERHSALPARHIRVQFV
ncbi:hypothetical protein C8T65DRAFT_665411 [Cerioporus squamosus]|nr:hypothetical protein C8T65DRAFT_665411 [Cerioporus squamosus]